MKNPNPLPESKCPVCGYVTDAATCVGHPSKRPRLGDISLCMGCGEILVFDSILSLHPAGLDDMLNLTEKTSKQLARVQALIRKTRPLEAKHVQGT